MLFVVDLIEKFPGFEALWISPQLFMAALEKQNCCFKKQQPFPDATFCTVNEADHDVVAYETGCITLRRAVFYSRWCPEGLPKVPGRESSLKTSAFCSSIQTVDHQSCNPLARGISTDNRLWDR